MFESCCETCFEPIPLISTHSKANRMDNDINTIAYINTFNGSVNNTDILEGVLK